MPAKNTRYALPTSNLCFAQGVAPFNYAPVLMNGNVSYPTCVSPLYEDDDFPMSNILLPDRYAVWKCPSMGGVAPVNPASSGHLYVEVDLGAVRSVRTWGVRNVSRVPGGTLPETVSCWYSPGVGNDPNVYAPAHTQIGTSASVSSRRDAIIEATGPVSARYLAFVFHMGSPYTTGFSVGGLFAMGPAMADLGFAYGPGTIDATVMQNSRVRMLGGEEYVTSYGPNRRRFTMQFKNVTEAVRVKLRDLSLSTRPFLLYTATDEPLECRAISNTFEAEAVWGIYGSASKDVWNVVFEVESLP